VDVDVARFERLVADAGPEALVQATYVYRGDLLDGFEEWLTFACSRSTPAEELLSSLA
jgi:hypothetical protein